MGDRLEYVDGRSYRRIDGGLPGLASSWITVSALTTGMFTSSTISQRYELVRLRAGL